MTTSDLSSDSYSLALARKMSDVLTLEQIRDFFTSVYEGTGKTRELQQALELPLASWFGRSGAVIGDLVAEIDQLRWQRDRARQYADELYFQLTELQALQPGQDLDELDGLDGLGGAQMVCVDCEKPVVWCGDGRWAHKFSADVETCCRILGPIRARLGA